MRCRVQAAYLKASGGVAGERRSPLSEPANRDSNALPRPADIEKGQTPLLA